MSSSTNQDMGDPLKTELELYESQKHGWLKEHRDEFVIIAGEEVGGFYANYETAYKAALQRFGLNALFLIKQICAVEPVYLVH